MKKGKVIGIAIISLLALGACSNNNAKESTENNSKEKVHKVETKQTESKGKEEKGTTLDALNKLATYSKTTDEIYVTGKIKVGEDETLNQGIYDMEITGGRGNITSERADINFLFINWVGGVPSDPEYDYDTPSKMRIIMFDGDTLELDNISKVKFTAVPEKAEMSNELHVGEYIVGRDIKAGDYKLGTNANLNKEFGNLGWKINIYNDEAGEDREQSLAPDNMDIVVSLKDGEIITTSLDNTDKSIQADDVKLTFEEIK